MDASKIEETLDDWVTESFNSGVSYDQIISAMELKIMALKEESENEDG